MVNELVPDNIIPFPKKKGKFKMAVSKVTGLPVCVFPALDSVSGSRGCVQHYSNEYRIHLQTEDDTDKDK
jgi:hypothetical protein